MGWQALRTGRLLLTRFSGQDPADDAFILALLNDPDFLRHIGDRGVHTLETARAYLLHGPVASYARHGHGLYRVDLRDSGERVGLCGLVRREALPGPDLGYALLPAFRGRGLAAEAAHAVVREAHEVLGIERVLAITAPRNLASIALLQALGFHHEGQVRLAADSQELRLYARAAGG